MTEPGTTTGKDQLERGRRFASKPRKGLRTSILPKKRGEISRQDARRRGFSMCSVGRYLHGSGRGIVQGLQRSVAGVESPFVCTSGARKTGETPCARQGQRLSQGF